MAEYIERTEELMLAMNAGARAIENTKRYHGTVYTKDVFSESPQEIPYLQAAKVLRQASDVPGTDVAPVVHGRWEWLGPNRLVTNCMCGTCSACKIRSKYIVNTMLCPNCGAKMDGGGGHESKTKTAV